MGRAEEVGSRLRLLREGLRLGVRELARRSLVQHPIIVDLEKGKGTRRLGTYADRLARVLGEEVLALARPGQIGLALDWGEAVRRADLDGSAREWLRKRARVGVEGEAIEVWQLGATFVLAPGDLLERSAIGA